MQGLRIVALGGLGEIGMNCLTLEHQGTLIAIDCGLTFPDGEQGVDVIHPDLGYLQQRRASFAALILTHGHEDHVGAVPYLLAKHDVPVHGPPHALAVLQRRLQEHRLEVPPRLHELLPRTRIRVGPFDIEPYRVTHSIPQSTGLVLRTPLGTLVHSGDFRFDPEPADGEHFDESALDQARAEGVRLLMSDSTNVMTASSPQTEASVARALARHIETGSQRVVVCLFASNLYRVKAALDAARALGRKVLWLGRSLHGHREIAASLGLMQDGMPEFVDERSAASLPRRELLVLATGSQGEERAALGRLAGGTHPVLRLEAGDLAILSSRVIPGNETSVHDMLDRLERGGVRTVTRLDDPEIHATGHASRDEQQRMIELTRPDAFLPLHGTHMHLSRHAELARSLGVPRTLVAHNGTPVDLDADGIRLADERVATGRVHLQGGRVVPQGVLEERTQLGLDGAVFVRVPLDASGSLEGRPDVQFVGVCDPEAEPALCVELERRVGVAVGALSRPLTEARVTECVERATRRYLRESLGARSLVKVAIRWRTP